MVCRVERARVGPKPSSRFLNVARAERPWVVLESSARKRRCMVSDTTVHSNGDGAFATRTLKGASAHADDAPPESTISTKLELSSAMRWARLAQPEWASFSLSQRFSALERAAKAMLRDRDTLLALVKEEMGKHEVEGLFSEALGPLETLKSWLRVLERAQSRPIRLSMLSFPGKSARVELIP